MTRLTYTEEDNDGEFHDPDSGAFVAPGETLEVPDDAVDEYLDHDVATFERAEDTAEGADVDATEAAEAEADDAPLDPGAYTIADLETELDDRDLSDEELDALADAERSGEDRDGAMEAIDDQRSGGE